jgi:hypothetical protein
MSLPYFNPLFLLFLLAQLAVDYEDINVCILRFLVFFLRRLRYKINSTREGNGNTLFNQIFDYGLSQ